MWKIKITEKMIVDERFYKKTEICQKFRLEHDARETYNKVCERYSCLIKCLWYNAQKWTATIELFEGGIVKDYVVRDLKEEKMKK